MTPARSLARGAALVGVLRIVSVAAGGVLSIVVARLLGPTGNGRYALAVALFIALSTLSTLGIEIGIIWLVSGKRWAVRSAFSTTQKAAAVLGLAGAALGLAVYELAPAGAFGHLEGRSIVPVLCAVPFAIAAKFASTVALAGERYEASIAIPGIQAIVELSAVSVLAALFGVQGAMIGLFVSQAVSAAAGLVLGLSRTQRHALEEAEGSAFANLRAAAAFGIKPYLANALSIFTYRFDLFLLGATASTADVGFYAVAVAVTNAVWLLPSALSTVLFPRVTALSAAEDQGERERVENLSFRHTTVLLVAAAAFLALVLPLIVAPVYGGRFAQAVDPALALLPGAVALGMSTVLYSALAGRGRPGYALVAALIITPLSMGLYFALIPPFGTVGAALASTVSYVTSAALAAYFMKRETRRPVLTRLIPGREEFGAYGLLARTAAGHVAQLLRS